jgi:hypothetical protein
LTRFPALNPLHRHSARSAAIGLTRVALHPGPNADPSAVTSRPLVFGIRASDRSCAPLVEVRDLALLWLRRAPFRGACFRTFRQGAPSHPSRTRVQEEVTPDIGLRPAVLNSRAVRRALRILYCGRERSGSGCWRFSGPTEFCSRRQGLSAIGVATSM